MTRPPGYVARVEPDELDVARLSASDRARRARSAGNPEEAARLLRKALALWRGQALADFAYEPFAQPAIARLEELRLVALQERVESDLALGRDSDLVGEVEALVAEYPLREGLRGQLMLALYRSGGQAEALEAYQQARSVSSRSSGSTRARRSRISRRPSCARIRSSRRRRPAVTTRRPPLRHQAPLPRSGRSSWRRWPRRRPPCCSPSSAPAAAPPGHELLVARLLETEDANDTSVRRRRRYGSSEATWPRGRDRPRRGLHVNGPRCRHREAGRDSAGRAAGARRRYGRAGELRGSERSGSRRSPL